jgi:hypothetical protein
VKRYLTISSTLFDDAFSLGTYFFSNKYLFCGGIITLHHAKPLTNDCGHPSIFYFFGNFILRVYANKDGPWFYPQGAPKTIGTWGGVRPLQNTLRCKKGAVAPVQAKARDSLPWVRSSNILAWNVWSSYEICGPAHNLGQVYTPCACSVASVWSAHGRVPTVASSVYFMS